MLVTGYRFLSVIYDYYMYKQGSIIVIKQNILFRGPWFTMYFPYFISIVIDIHLLRQEELA